MIKSMLAALLGVGSQKHLQEDEKQSSWVRIITLGIIMAASFIAAIVVIVQLLLITH